MTAMWMNSGHSTSNDFPTDMRTWDATYPDCHVWKSSNYINTSKAPHVTSFSLEIETNVRTSEKKITLEMHVADKLSIDILNATLSKAKLETFTSDDQAALKKSFICDEQDTLFALLSIINTLSPFGESTQQDILSFFFMDMKSESANNLRANAFSIPALGDLAYATIRKHYHLFTKEHADQLPTDLLDMRPGLRK